MKEFIITVNGKSYEVQVQEKGASSVSAQIPVQVSASSPAQTAPAAPKPTAPTEKAPAPAPVSVPTGGTQIKAPMPGTILKVTVKSGDKVSSGAVLCILEAMKMENEILAPCAGTVASVNTSPGASVNSGDVLFVIS